jgi:hypothetical protein
VVQHTDADDRVELAPLEPFAGLDVADNDFGPVANAFPAAFDGRLADVDRDDFAAGLEQANRELARAAPEFETADTGTQGRVVDQEARAACRPLAARHRRPPPHALEAARDDLLALAPLRRRAMRSLVDARAATRHA